MKDTGEGKIGSVELIIDLLRNAALSKKEKARLKRELELEGEGGKGTVWLESWKDYEKVADKCNGNLLSPGGAAGSVGISRARVHQLEAEGRITVYRIKTEELEITEEDFKDMLKDFPFWIRPFIALKKPKPKAAYVVLVDMASLERYMKSQGREKKHE
ncbi:MAG: hypothetical protein PH343_04475 [Nitrospira sp.]|nr:hypothetical protein [Nitrospira sp.]